METQVTAVQRWIDALVVFVVKYGFQVLGALIVLYVGFQVAKWTSKLFADFCESKKLDITLTKFFSGIVRVLVLAFTVLIALGQLGVNVTPLVAALSAAIFGASLALQGTLSNYAAGLTIILTRPFKVGNTITVSGVYGTVEDIKLASTLLLTGDNERITVPNKKIVGEIMKNSYENRMTEIEIGIGYSSDPEKAISVIHAALASFPQILKTPVPTAGIRRFGDSAIELQVRYAVPASQYLSTLHAVNLAVYRALKQASIEIPFPQREIRLVTGDSSNDKAFSGFAKGAAKSMPV